MFYRRKFRAGKKRGSGVETTGCGKGSRWIVVVEGRTGLPVAITAHSARPGEIRLAEPTLDSISLRRRPERLVGDTAYYSKPHRELFRRKYGCELIAPPKSNYKNSPQDGRLLRRMSRRWKVEHANCHLKKFRRLMVRYETKLENFHGLLVIACMLLALRRF